MTSLLRCRNVRRALRASALALGLVVVGVGAASSAPTPVQGVAPEAFVAFPLTLDLLRSTTPSQPCSPVLAKPEHGAQAVASLGARLTETARSNGMSAPELEELLVRDPTLWIDRCGQAFYVDPARPVGAPGAAAAPTAAPPFPSEQTFLLHSRPGANRVIYLDFDGHVLTGTVSGSSNSTFPAVYSASAYDTDGAPSTFSEAEREIVQRAWQRVAEDFAPFDVDVTTQDPGVAAIQQSGCRRPASTARGR